MSDTEHPDTPTAGSPEQATTALAPVSDDTIDRMESAVLRRITAERATQSRQRRTHRRVWAGVGSAAAVVVVAAAIAPAVGGMVSPMSAGSSAIDESSGSESSASDSSASDESSVPPGGADAFDTDRIPQQESQGASAGLIAQDAAGAGAAGAPTATEGDVQEGRDIVASASASVTVDDISDAADEVTALAEQYGGYVEGLSVGTDGGVTPLVDDTSAIYPEQPRAGYGWVNVRVPADQLQAAIDELDAVGDVSAVSINRSDVTDQAIDLRARVAATSASVGRLTELMTQSGSVADLIAAEVALSDRQALLEGYEQQLAQLDSQVALSSLNVQLMVETETVVADPAGFGDGLVAGWNGLVATLNGIVIAIGFLLPWLVVAGAAALIIRLVIRVMRRRRSARDETVA